MARKYRKPQESRLVERWQVQREYFRDDSYELLTEGWCAVHATEAEAEAEMAKLKSGWASWAQPDDVLYVSPVWCGE